jgi:ABC-type sugar transport system substrate-binding protein
VRRIGYISGSFDIPPMHDRMAGYREALQAAGLQFESELVRIGNFHVLDGYNATMQLLSLHGRTTGQGDRRAGGQSAARPARRKQGRAAAQAGAQGTPDDPQFLPPAGAPLGAIAQSASA